MRAIVVPRFGGPEVLELRDVAEPVLAADQVLVKIKYAGMTYGDVYQREGTYRGGKPIGENEAALPIGGEGAGTIVAVGADVRGLAVGDTVIYCETLGSYAELVAVPAWRVIKIPADIDIRDAAAVFAQGVTAHYLAYDTGKLAPGMTCLVHAAAGGVGHVLVQLAKGLGARVIATVGSPEKADFVKGLGADKVILYRDTPFLPEVKAWTDGAGVDVVYDSIGQATIADSMKATKVRGLCVLYGNASGLVDTISPMDLAAAGSIYFTRPRLGHHVRNREEIQRRADDLFEGLRKGTLKVALNKVFPLADVVEAHKLLGSRTATGRILLEVA